MDIRLKRIADQVIVITGASSGIGLTTAMRAARAGASVVLAARNERVLMRIVGDIEAIGGQATYVVADVAVEREVQHIADVAIREFGGFDSWVNNASTSIFGRLSEVPLADMRRLFDVNFWGVVHGSLAAVPHLRERGGAIVNVGSVLSDRAIPLQGIYSAAKHAVKAFTDTLRMELEKDGVPISVSLVKPASIDTPFFEHARNYMPMDPKPMPPVYAPGVAAEAILACTQRPLRDVFAGGGAKMISSLGRYAPRLTDRAMKRTTFEGQQADRPSREDRNDNLYAPMEYDGFERGRYEGHVMSSSLYTQAALHPKTSVAAALGLGLAVAAGVGALRGRRTVGEQPAERTASADGGVADQAEGAMHVPA